MSELVRGVVVATTGLYIVIALPDGREIQVLRDAIGVGGEHIDGVPLLPANTQIEAVFTKQRPRPKRVVLIPGAILDRIPAE